MIILETLKSIEQELRVFGDSVRNETRVCQLELEDRQRLGLSGDAAIRHYNEWMQRYHLDYLMVKDF